MSWQLAQCNVATAKFDDDDPRFAEFVGNLDRINGVCDRSVGAVWRFRDESGTALGVRLFGDARTRVNLSVWDDLASLWNAVYETEHADFLRRRSEWFEVEPQAAMVMWWVRPGCRPTPTEGKARLEYLRANGPSPDAFSFRDPYGPPGPEHARGCSA